MNGIGMVGSQAAVKETQTHKEMSVLSGAISCLEEKIKVLSGMLTVIRDIKPVVPQQEKPKDACLVPLANDIRTQREKIDRLLEVLNTLISELEI